MEHKVCSTDHFVKGALLEQVSCMQSQLPRQRLQDDGRHCCDLLHSEVESCNAATASIKLSPVPVVICRNLQAPLQTAKARHHMSD